MQGKKSRKKREEQKGIQGKNEKERDSNEEKQSDTEDLENQMSCLQKVFNYSIRHTTNIGKKFSTQCILKRMALNVWYACS